MTTIGYFCMAYPKSSDPVKTRGVSIPESIWECLKDHARNDQRSTSAYITILLFEAINARRVKLGLPAFDSPEDLQAATIAKQQARRGSAPENPTELPKAAGF
jgi:hypothetical protein